MTMLAVGFIIAKFLGFSAEQDTENHSHSCCVVDTGSPCPSSLFLVVSRCLSSARLSGWGERKAGHLCNVLRGWRNWSLILLSLLVFFFSQQGKMSQAGEFPLDAEQCWPRGRDDANKM